MGKPSTWLLLACAGAGTCQSRPAPVDDALALLQAGVGSSGEREEPALEPGKPNARSMKLRNNTFNCWNFPDYCAPPFNCGAPKTKRSKRGLGASTAEGHANYQAWCDVFPNHAKAMVACVNGDLPKYSELMLQEHTERSTGVGKMNFSRIQAQYCFQVGHCNDTEVDVHTTPLQAEALCDQRWTHAAWAQQLTASEIYLAWQSGVNSGKIWRHARDQRKQQIDDGYSRALGKLTCAMGNYHCDVHYCKEVYCSNKAWQQEFPDLLWPEQQKKRRATRPGGRHGRPREQWPERW